MEKELYFNPFAISSDMEGWCSRSRERMTNRQLKELREKLRKEKEEYERDNKVYISEERKEEVYGYY